MRLVSQLGLLVFLSVGSNQEVLAFRLPLHNKRNVLPSISISSSSSSLSVSKTTRNNDTRESQYQTQQSRRDILEKVATSLATVVAATATGVALPNLIHNSVPSPAFASGGATAGKYTTIPIAKRRYYGRVQAAVHDFLKIGPTVIEGDMSASAIQNFFDPQGLVVVEAKRQDINGQCTKKDGSCKGKEVRDSIYNDMKTSMYLLGNAFRLNQTKAPDNLPSVRAAKAFFREMDLVEKAAKKGKKSDRDAIAHYAAALDALDQFLDLVELPPTDSGWYDQEFNRAVGEGARIT